MPVRKGERSTRHGEGPKHLARTQSNVLETPKPPPHLCEPVAEAWDLFWDSSLADFIHVTDLPALRRLFVNYDELERTRNALYTEASPKPVQRVDEGHNDFQMRIKEWRIETEARGRLMPRNGGLALNPLLTHMRALEKNIIALEDRFGFTLRARQELGLNQIRARTLAEQNAAQMLEHDADKDEDPRADLLKPAADKRR